MADIETTPVTETGNQVVGKVSILYGTVKAMSPDGTVRVLDVNSPVYAEDHIITESDGSVSIVLDDPAQTHLDIGRMSDVVIDEDVYGGAAPEDVAQASAEVQEIQQALLAGDETIDVDMEATAAGGTASAGGGHPVYVVDATGEEVTPTAFAETEGWEQGQPDTIPGVNEPPVEPPPPESEPEPEPAPPDNLPEIGPEEGTVYESDIPDEASGVFDITSADGIAAVRVGGVDVTAGGTVPGTYGDLVVTVTDGVYSWTYTLNDNTELHSVQGNDTLLDTFALEVEDPDGDVEGDTLTITVVDDMPTAVDDFNDITEDGGPNSVEANVEPVVETNSVSGNVLDNDESGADEPTNFVSWDSSLSGTYGTLTDDGDGKYTYELNDADPDVQALDDGETRTDTFNYTMQDAEGDEDTATLTITVHGTNDAPVAIPDTNWAQEDVSDASGNVLQTIPHTGQPSGGPFSDVADTDVDVEDLTVSSVNGSAANVGTLVSGVYGDLTLNSTGSYDYILNDAHPDVQELDDGETLTETFSYTAFDGTVDSAPVNLEITIFGSNDAPTIGVQAERHMVYEAGLPTGSLAASDSESADGFFTFADSDGLDDINSITIGGTTFTRGVDFNNFVDLLNETAVLEYGTVELTSYDGNGTYGYTYTLDNPVDNDDPAAVAAGADDEGYDEEFDVTVDDGTTDATGTVTVHIVDDNPVVIAPDSLHILDGGGGEEHLNFVAGADGLGTVEFNVDSLIDQVATDTDGRELTLNGETLFLHYGADNTVLVAKTAGGAIGFTIDIDPTTNTYSIDAHSFISNGTAVTPTSLQGPGGGNFAWDALTNVGGTSQDVLITTASSTTVNTSNNSFGVSSGQSMVDGEGLRLDFVNGLTVTGNGPSKTYTYDGTHNLSSVYTQEIFQVVGTSANLTVTAILADGDYDFYAHPAGETGETIINLDPSDITVYNSSGVEVASGTSGLLITDAGDSVLIEGLDTDWSFQINSDSQFSAIQIDAAAETDPFKLGTFTYGEESLGDPVELSYAVTGTDGDGDTTDGFLHANIYPEVDETGDDGHNILLGTDGDDDLDGYAGDDILAGGQGDDDLDGGDGSDELYGGSGDDTLVGGAGEDMLHGGSGNDELTGGADADTFKASVGNDTIMDYNQGDGDLVDISELFDGVAPTDTDTLGVSNDGGYAKLSIFNQDGAERGSITFNTIDFVADLDHTTPETELDSLLGMVDVDSDGDGTPDF